MTIKQLELINKDEFWKWMKSRYCFKLEVLQKLHPDVDAIIDEANSKITDANLKIVEINKLKCELLDTILKNECVQRFFTQV